MVVPGEVQRLEKVVVQRLQHVLPYLQTKKIVFRTRNTSTLKLAGEAVAVT